MPQKLLILSTPHFLILTFSFLPHSIPSFLLPSKILFFLLFHSPFPTLTLYPYFEAKYHYICQAGLKYSNLLPPASTSQMLGRQVCGMHLFYLLFKLLPNDLRWNYILKKSQLKYIFFECNFYRIKLAYIPVTLDCESFKLKSWSSCPILSAFTEKCSHHNGFNHQEVSSVSPRNEITAPIQGAFLITCSYFNSDDFKNL